MSGSTPHVVVFGLGGTISMSSATGAGAVPALSAAELVAAVPGLAAAGIDIEVVEFRRVPGASVSFEDVDALAEAIEERLAGGATGVVVVQGTDTIEETAYLLDLGHTRPEPVVVTGAMRNAAQAGADGPANLLAAIQTAATASGHGVLVVLADEIHAAARVRKTHSTSGHTFVSADGGPLGYVVEGQPRFLNGQTGRKTVVGALGKAVDVGLVTMTLGDSGTSLRAAHEFDGLVIAGFGAGHVPVGVVDRLTELAANMPVVLASRTGAGSVLSRTYGFPGSESDLLNRGLISAHFLDPLKARILLHRLLATGHDIDRIRATFGQNGWR